MNTRIETDNTDLYNITIQVLDHVVTVKDCCGGGVCTSCQEKLDISTALLKMQLGDILRRLIGD